MEIIISISILVFLLYTATIFSFAIGWLRIKKFCTKPDFDKPIVSIVIACRNEEKNITGLLDSLEKQNYSKANTEIIIVDDHSEDETVKILQRQSNLSIKLLHLPNEVAGKKEALRYGINLAQSEIILTTDADCAMKENWITSMVSYYVQYKPKLLVAPVILSETRNIFQKFQSLEFLSLISSGAGAIGIGKPIMCNGANLLFEKSMYQHALLENNYVSGDDIFLLLQIKKQYPKSIHFIKSTDSIVYTKPAISLQEFFEQRIRWASKSKAYRDIDIVFVAVIVALVNYILTFSLLASVFYKHIFYYYLFFLVIKSVIDLSLLYPFNYFFKRHRLMWLFIPLQIIYPFYITDTSIAGLAGRFTWKNRNFR